MSDRSGQQIPRRVITTNGPDQPKAAFDVVTGFVRVEFDGKQRLLSAAMAEEFAWSIEHAAKLARETPV